MSRAAPSEANLPEKVVRNWSQFAGTLHRLDPDADEACPACPEGDRPGPEFKDVPLNCYPNYELCSNPECFGGEWR